MDISENVFKACSGVIEKILVFGLLSIFTFLWRKVIMRLCRKVKRRIKRCKIHFISTREYVEFLKFARIKKEIEKKKEIKESIITHILLYALDKKSWRSFEAANGTKVNADAMDVYIEEAKDRGLIEINKALQIERIFGMRGESEDIYQITTKGKKYLLDLGLIDAVEKKHPQKRKKRASAKRYP